jgi:hypothetical protein
VYERTQQRQGRRGVRGEPIRARQSSGESKANRAPKRSPQARQPSGGDKEANRVPERSPHRRDSHPAETKPAGCLRTAHGGSGPAEARPAGRSGGVHRSCGSDRPAPWAVEPPVAAGPQGRDDAAPEALPARPGGSDPTSIVQSRSRPAAVGNQAVEDFAFSRALARGRPERGSRARQRCAEKAAPRAPQRAPGRRGETKVDAATWPTRRSEVGPAA